jgi:small subunit ribosomal protein S1
MESEPHLNSQYQLPQTQAVDSEPPVDRELPTDTDMESLLQSQEEHFAFQHGDMRVGQVIEIGDKGALIDIGLKREGLASPEDLDQMRRAQMEEVHVGDKVPVIITGDQSSDGCLQVSIFQARLSEDWLKAEQMQKSGEIYETQIVGHNRGGLIVKFGRIRGFIPMSQIVEPPRTQAAGTERPKQLAAMVGQTVGLRVIEVDRTRRRLIFSQRQAYRSWQRTRKRRLLDELKEGERRKGVISNVTNFGAFVDLGGVEGLVHVSELCWQRVDDPHDVVNVGDKVEVIVLEVDRAKERIGLSIRQTLGDPWEQVEDKYVTNQVVEGRVTRVTELGAFVELEPGVEGLLHSSELVGAPSVTPQELLKVGDLVPLKVLRVESSRRRIGLSARRVRREEWEEWAAGKAAHEQEPPIAEQEQAAEEPVADQAEPPALAEMELPAATEAESFAATEAESPAATELPAAEPELPVE